MPDLPIYKASPSNPPDCNQAIETYLIFREHWDLIDKVFEVETPGKPSIDDYLNLEKALQPYFYTNPVAQALFTAVDLRVLDELPPERRAQILKERKTQTLTDQK